MDTSGYFPGEDTDEVLDDLENREDRSDIQDLDDKVDWLNENFSMDELKGLEDEGSEYAEEAMIARARSEAGEETVDEVFRDTQNWANNPDEALGQLQKAMEYDEQSVDEETRAEERAEVFQTLLDNGHIRAAKKFDEMVDGSIKISRWNRDDDADEDLTREEIIREAAESRGYGLKSLEELRKMDQYFDEASIGSYKKSKLVSEYLSRNEYKKAVRRADMLGVDEVEIDDEEVSIEDAANQGYEDRMDEGEYQDAAEIAKRARRRLDGSESQRFEEEEKKAAKEALKTYVTKGKYDEAMRVAKRHPVGGGDEIQASLTKALLNEEISEDEYEELTEEVGYQVQGQNQEPEYEQEPSGYEENTTKEEDRESSSWPEEEEKDQGGILGTIREYI